MAPARLVETISPSNLGSRPTVGSKWGLMTKIRGIIPMLNLTLSAHFRIIKLDQLTTTVHPIYLSYAVKAKILSRIGK